MPNLIHIAQGWFASQIYATDQQKEVSLERLEECEVCPDSIESDILQIRGDDDIESVKTRKCSHCGCPNIEKSLVLNETCPLGKWKR
jgi:hypothetical protein